MPTGTPEVLRGLSAPCWSAGAPVQHRSSVTPGTSPLAGPARSGVHIAASSRSRPVDDIRQLEQVRSACGFPIRGCPVCSRASIPKGALTESGPGRGRARRPWQSAQPARGRVIAWLRRKGTGSDANRPKRGFGNTGWRRLLKGRIVQPRELRLSAISPSSLRIPKCTWSVGSAPSQREGLGCR